MKDSEKRNLIFYADNGFTGGFNYIIVQHTLDKYVKNFKSVGLNMNVKKTKTITLTGSKPMH
jgi:hypothetical protein